MKTLNDFIRNTKRTARVALAGGLIGGLSLTGILNNGCATMSNAQMKAAAGTVLSESNDPAVSILGDVLAITGIMENQVDAAKAGKTVVNVYNNPQNQGNIQADPRLIPEYDRNSLQKQIDQVNLGIHGVFTYSRYLDLNGDNQRSLDEFNLKRNFKKEEPVNISVIYSNASNSFDIFKNPTKFYLEITDKNNQIVYTNNWEDTFRLTRVLEKEFNLANNLEPGIYNIKVYLKDVRGDGRNDNFWIGSFVGSRGGVFQVLE